MAAELTGQDWLVSQVEPNCERRAIQHLDRLGAESFAPWLWSPRDRRRERLFPGYVFVRSETHPGALRRTAYVVRLLGGAETPATLADALVAGWRALMDWSGTIRLNASPFSKGDQVKLKHGPFADMIGLYDGMDSEQRVCVLFNLLGRQTRVRCPSGLVVAA